MSKEQEEFQKKMLSSKLEARKFLLKTGIYTPTGRLKRLFKQEVEK